MSEEVIELKGLRGFIETIDAWGDKRGLPCLLAWTSVHMPRFSNWFWRDV